MRDRTFSRFRLTASLTLMVLLGASFLSDGARGLFLERRFVSLGLVASACYILYVAITELRKELRALRESRDS